MNKLELVSQDARGWIYRLVRPGGSEVIIIFTKAGFWRGGEYHNSAQTDFLVFGKLYWLRVLPMSGTQPPKFAPETFWVKYDQGPGNRRIHLAPQEGHVVRAEEDTLYVEWLDGLTFEKTYVPEMRKLVEAQIGRIYQTEHGSQQQSTEKVESTSTKSTRKSGRKDTTSQSQS